MGSSTKANLPDLPLVVVEWDDAWAIADTPATPDEARLTHRPEPVTTIGWVLHQDEVGIQVANEFYDNSYRGRTFILAQLIRSVTPYKLFRPRQPKVAG